MRATTARRSQVHYKGKNISEVLDMPISEAAEFFEPISAIHRYMATLVDVGLGYVRLGQSATTLSGGEAQRVKLATELQRRSNGRTRLRARRADDRSALRGRPQAAPRAAEPGRQGQHRHHDRAQPRRHQVRRLAHRHGSRGRLRRRDGPGHGHPGARRRPSRRATPVSSCARSSTPRTPGSASSRPVGARRPRSSRSHANGQPTQAEGGCSVGGGHRLRGVRRRGRSRPTRASTAGVTKPVGCSTSARRRTSAPG